MITITRTITESDHHRKRDPRSSTGWVKSVRYTDVEDTDVVIDEGPARTVDGRYPRYVFVEAPAPIGPVPVESPDAPRGGTIGTEVTGVTPLTIDLTKAEVEAMVRGLAGRFWSGLFLASGGSDNGTIDPAAGVVEAVQAYKRALDFGVDLFTQSNIWADRAIRPEVVENIRSLVS